MRVSQRFVMAWVVGLLVTAAGLSLVAYFFIRDRAAELDTVLNLPDPPQLGRPAADAPEPTVTPSPEPLAETPPFTPPPGADEPATADPATSPEAGEEAAGEVVADAAAYSPWEDPRRVSVLLLGIDQREGEEGSFPTDTIILFSIDPVGKTGAILSIPRDLWVEYPGLGRTGRINTANIVGDDISYPGGGGPAYAMKTVEKVLGVPVHYYMLINFEVFYTLIDAVGPIEVCPDETIHDDQYPDGSYGIMTVRFEAGCQELDAERLLQYARTRHADSDISRSSRQQEVILSVRDKVLSTGGVTRLIPQAAELWRSAQDNVRTNLTFEEMVRLALRAEEIPEGQIRQGQITFEDVQLGTSPEGDEILVPIGTDIRLKVESLFHPAPQ